VDLLCIDELGYMELEKRGAELLFQVLTEREEKNSVAIASNQSFFGLDPDVHRPDTLRGHRRPTHLRRRDHRNRHRQLPARSNQGSNPSRELTGDHTGTGEGQHRRRRGVQPGHSTNPEHPVHRIRVGPLQAVTPHE
jgi:hypothetical protein